MISGVFQSTTPPEIIVSPIASPNASQANFLCLTAPLFSRYSLHPKELKRKQLFLQITTHEGPVLNFFLSGTVQLQGKNTGAASDFHEALNDVICEIGLPAWRSAVRQFYDDARLTGSSVNR